MPPAFQIPRALQTLRLSMRQADYVFRARRELGEVFLYRGIVDDEPIVFTSHPTTCARCSPRSRTWRRR